MIVERVTFGLAVVDVKLDKGKRFHAEMDGKTYSADSYDKLVEAVRKAARLAKLEHDIPVVILYGGRYRRAALRGIHSGRSEYLFTIDGKKEGLSHPTILSRGENVTDGELAELNARREASEAAGRYERELHDLIVRRDPVRSARQLLDDADKRALEEAPAAE